MFVNSIKSAIVPIIGTELSEEERELFEKYNPLGYIIFSRNYSTPEQLAQLICDLKEIAKREEVLILIDQEGQRVARLREPNFTVIKNAAEYGKDYDVDARASATRLRKDFKIVGEELRNVGVNVNCAPVADFHHDFADPIIGIRSYGSDVNKIVDLCNAVDHGLADAKVQSVIKHIPGHGHANVDSHLSLPIIDTHISDLVEKDFNVFQKLNNKKLAMTAHVIVSAIDQYRPVTLSSKMIKYIRYEIGFNGVIITDALDMKALQGDEEEIAVASSEAGCDILLYCKPNLLQVKKTLDGCHYLTDKVAQMIRQFNCF